MATKKTRRGNQRHGAKAPKGKDQLAEARLRLGDDKPALAFFDRFANILGEMSNADLELLVLGAETRSRMDSARKEVKKMGVLVKSQRGAYVKNPALSVERTCAVELRSILKQLNVLDENATPRTKDAVRRHTRPVGDPRKALKVVP